RGEHPGVGEGGGRRVVQEDDVGRVALLRRERRLVGQLGSVERGALDRQGGLVAAGCHPHVPLGAVGGPGGGVRPGEGAAGGGLLAAGVVAGACDQCDRDQGG